MPKVLHLLTDRIETPTGEMLMVADHDGKLRAFDWSDHEPRMRRFLQLHYGADGFKLEQDRGLDVLKDLINSYFAGDLNALGSVPVQTGGTNFQRKVWRSLREIPPGTTVSYMELAKRICHPTSVRAVGLANGSNPVALVVPCHRVIGSNGSLTGYGGGLERKRWLLEHERKHSAH
jgi:methylated-DNA-[protein]-cysteine S-methyltransferase